MNKLWPYVSLLKDNRGFRNLFMSSLVSFFGDWFNEIGCIVVIKSYSKSSLLLSLLFIARELPPIFWTPITGVAADYFDRRRVMIAADILRSLVVLLYITVHSKNTLWILYITAIAQSSLASFFQPASGALVPQLVPSEKLVYSNVLLSFMWSMLLVIGAGIGGVFTYGFGTTADFLVDSASYLVSAFFIYHTFKEPLNTTSGESEISTEKKNENMFMEGLRFLKHNPYFLVIALAKASGAFVWATAELYLIGYSADYFSDGDSSLLVGIMLITSGIGVGLGPVIVQALVSDSDKNNRLMIAFGQFTLFTGMIAMALLDNLVLFLIMNAWRTIGSGLVWIYSSSILQRRVPNKFMGRVTSFEFSMLLFASCTTRICYGLLIDEGGMHPRTAMMLYAGIGFLVCCGWVIFALWKNKQDEGKGEFIQFTTLNEQDENDAESQNVSETPQ